MIAFPCEGETLVGSLDEAAGTTGLLIVSGGNEIRCGAHRGMTQLAVALAERGVPVFRFDRRGIGDSTGENSGFAFSGPDIMAAVSAFRAAMPSIKRLAGFGNCDAATALLLHGADAFDKVILANPWVVEQADDLPPAAAIRSRYADRLRDPAAWTKLLTGQVNIGNLMSGLAKIAHTSSEMSSLEATVIAALTAHADAHVVLAAQDATAIAFADAARRAGHDPNALVIDTASHSFAGPAEQAALLGAIVTMLG